MFVLLAVFVVLLPLLLAIWLGLVILDIPRRVGERIDFESRIRAAVYAAIPPDRMKAERDRILQILESEAEVPEDFDRWGTLREIDKSKRRVEARLRSGEFAFSFAGGVLSLVVGSALNVLLGGVLLTIVALSVSLLVAFRLGVTEAVAFTSINHRYESPRRLIIMNRWNKGPLSGQGAMGVVMLSVLDPDGVGYRVGLSILDRIAQRQYDVQEDTWAISTETSLSEDDGN